MTTITAVIMGEVRLGDVLFQMKCTDHVLLEWLEEGKLELLTVDYAKYKYAEKLEKEVYKIDGNIGVDKVISIEIGEE